MAKYSNVSVATGVALLASSTVVDAVEVAIVPVLLGGGIPLLPPTSMQTTLRLTGHRIYGTGIVALEYTVGTSAA